jgi:hypothetical protein
MKAPVYRYLRGYSLDPGFSTRLDTAGINELHGRHQSTRVRPDRRSSKVGMARAGVEPRITELAIELDIGD